ncbi:uncharacterized protein YneF (UPF0154 family) [Peribacillus huizhouensis]|uniref:Uncharacterized protein YneF (UPF0154 family) n=1 Tax=Peribacillus huizhouensis TaxID=1501239 RepID=A0ABR6CMS2_9BACI|nr:DUF4064 domain-containing protein [Bacillus cihuensis]MBA9026231.1 uncharacterized protein YneF (UPF0154 family) [Peribacillus huizhouensis]
MKRTGEYILAIIGILLSVILTFIGVFFIALKQNDGIRQVIEAELANDPTITMEDFSLVMDAVGGFGWLIVVASAIGIILGLVSIFILRSKRQTMAGVFFIITAVLVGLLSIGLGLLQAVLFLIVGIMCFVRKPKNADKDPVVTM